MSRSRFKIFTKFFIFLAVMFSCYKVFAFFRSPEDIDFNRAEKIIFLNDNGLEFSLKTTSESVEEMLQEKNIKLGDKDKVLPEKENKIYPGTRVRIRRAVKIKIQADGNTIENYTLAQNVNEALLENNIVLTRLDKTVPSSNTPVQNNTHITVTRINIEEKIEQEEVDFKSKVKLDSKMGWREKDITTPGGKGLREVKYKVTYKNGKEVSRVVLSKNIVKEPVTQVETQGTYVKVGKSHKGQGTWYAFKGGLFAASPWLPMGSYAKVTNTANGKSVIVQINDRGPFGPGRIIDLDKVAWQKIAALGTGVIGVKVEEVLN